MGPDIHPVGYFHDERSSYAGDQRSVRRAMTTGSSTKRDLQLSMIQEVAGILEEAREEAESVFVQVVVKSRYRFHVQELVKEPPTPSPLASIAIQGEIPRVHIHT